MADWLGDLTVHLGKGEKGTGSRLETGSKRRLILKGDLFLGIGDKE